MPLSDSHVKLTYKGEKNDPHRTRIAAKNKLPVRFPKKTKSERGEREQGGGGRNSQLSTLPKANQDNKPMSQFKHKPQNGTDRVRTAIGKY